MTQPKRIDRQAFTIGLEEVLERFVDEGGAQGWEICRGDLGGVRVRIWFGLGSNRLIGEREVLPGDIPDVESAREFGHSIAEQAGLDLIKLMRIHAGKDPEPHPLDPD